MADPVADTLAWYRVHAEDFATQNCRLDLGLLYDRFLHYVGPRGRILDAGCGSGRDTAAFMARGYEVVAFDATEEMVQLARSRTGHGTPVHHMRFEDVAWTTEFDGIWACASLLHVPLASFAVIVSTLADALHPGGAFYMSFKLGDRERVSGGRFFVDFTPESLRRSLLSISLTLVETWLSDDVRPTRQGDRWVNAIATADPAGGLAVSSF